MVPPSREDLCLKRLEPSRLSLALDGRCRCVLTGRRKTLGQDILDGDQNQRSERMQWELLRVVGPVIWLMMACELTIGFDRLGLRRLCADRVMGCVCAVQMREACPTLLSGASSDDDQACKSRWGRTENRRFLI